MATPLLQGSSRNTRRDNALKQLDPYQEKVRNEIVAPPQPVSLPRPTYSSPNQVSAQNLAQATPYTPAPPDPLTDFKAFVSSVSPASNSGLSSYRDELRSRIDSTLAKFEGQGARYGEVENQLELPQQRKQLSELNLQIAQLKGEFDKAVVNEEGAVRPIEFITGRQAQIEKQRAVQIGALASVQQALTGNIALAEQTAKTTVEREFQDEEAYLKRLQFEYDENRADLEKEDKAQADNLALYLAERTRLLDQEKSDRSEVLKLAQEAAKNGADNTILAQMVRAKTPEEALSIGGTSLAPIAEPTKVVFQTLDDGRTVAIDPYTGQIINDLGGIKPTNPEEARKLQQAALSQRLNPNGLDDTEYRKTKETVEGNEELLRLVSEYRDLVAKKGFTVSLGSDTKAIGQIDAYRSQLTAAYKQAKTLGTLDAGLLTLMEQVIGERPVSPNPFSNLGNRRSNKIVSQLDELINSTQLDLGAKKAKLGIPPEYTVSEWTELQQLESLAEPEELNSLSNGEVSIGANARLAQVNNNPGNLRFAGQLGAMQGEGGFARFPSPQAGVAALERQIALDTSRGLTLAQFINKYAPPSENNTSQYLSQVMQQLGVTANTPLAQVDKKALTRAVALKESNTRIG